MNIKDRLKESKKNNVKVDIEVNEKDKYENVSDIFSDGKYVKNLVRNYIKDSKNIIFITNPSFDNNIAANYFKSFANKSLKAKITFSVPSSPVALNIIPEPTIKDIVKIFENIMCSNKSYIFGLKIASNDNIIEKLNTLIAVNYTNLIKDNIDILIGSSQSVFVYIGTNDDGLFLISRIEELNNVDGQIKLEKVYDSESAFVLSEENSVENKQEPEIDNKEILPEQDLSEPVQEEQQESLNDTVEESPLPKKINKYKILKNKIKSKKDKII